MNEKLKSRIIEEAEAHGWNVSVDEEGDWGFYQYSPAGEDFGIEFKADAEDVAFEVRAYADGFDPDEHVAMWLEAKMRNTRGGVPSARALAEDADEIAKMLEELADALEQIEEEDWQ